MKKPALLLICLTLSLTARAAVTDSAVEQVIAGARSKSDHEALVRYYEEEARTLHAKAELHKRMAESYRNRFTGPRNSAAALARHCDALASKYGAAAAENMELAVLHQRMATETKH